MAEAQNEFDCFQGELNKQRENEANAVAIDRDDDENEHQQPQSCSLAEDSSTNKGDNKMNVSNDLSQFLEKLLLENQRKDALLEKLIDKISDRAVLTQKPQNIGVMPGLLSNIASFDGNSLKARGNLRECAKLKNKKTQDENERNYNKKRKPHKRLNEGDIVMIKRTSPENDVNPKMSAKFVGPYQITKVLDNDRYCVADLPEHQVSQKPFTAVLAPERIKLWKRFEVDDEVGSEEDLEDETDPETEVDRAEEPNNGEIPEADLQRAEETNNGEIPEADLQEVSDLDEQDVEEVIRIVVTDDPDIGTMSDQDGRL
ncbi:hypothetical protein QE152_g24327 [Popillia japonica]|uniref:Uncharacterized protein n=1 Tax=Popillia japonica TaxID=7064 RepID=A0AAW1KBV5_POPJA